MKIQATLSIAFPSGGGVNIRLRDIASRIEFVDVEISHAEFSQALSALQERPLIECELRGLEYVGKKRITEARSVECPIDAHDRDVLRGWLKMNCQENGWILNDYLGSQISIERRDGKTVLNYSVTKYVEAAE
jgi:hypothetical protein